MSNGVRNAASPVVLITAGAAGIGRIMAEAFLGNNYRVHVCDSDPAAIDSFLQANTDISATQADISDVAEVAQVFDDLADRCGRLDVLVNNAGIAGPTACVEDIDPADWDRTIAVDLSGHFYCTRQAIPLLKKSRGSIINIASNAALTGCPGRAPYAASKWGIIGLTKTMAMELGPDVFIFAKVRCAHLSGPMMSQTWRCFSPPIRPRKFPDRRSDWTGIRKRWRTGWTDESSMV
jgi:NAD(P)-dependent dehydrogenase (short-subunit alcohol dehydrogenase family)